MEITEADFGILDGVPEKVVRYLAWLARRHHLARPRGRVEKVCRPGSWHRERKFVPDPLKEGTPKDPDSMDLLRECKTKRWCLSGLVLATAREDAVKALMAPKEIKITKGYKKSTEPIQPVLVSMMLMEGGEA